MEVNKVIDIVDSPEIESSSEVVGIAEKRQSEVVASGGVQSACDDVGLVSAVSSSKRTVVVSDQQQRQTFHKNQLCCPLTKQPFHEPVVHCQGDTFEKKAIEEQFVNATCYPNRALKEYLDPKTDSGVELGRFRYYNDDDDDDDDNHDHEVQPEVRINPQIGTTQSNFRGCFYCPITCSLLRDPVIDPEGNTYERHAIEAWIRKHGVSPITRNPLEVEQLYDNSTLLYVLVKEVQTIAGDDFITEDIEEWKREVSDVPKADPPLSAKELEQALGSPAMMVSDPSVSVLREALQGQPESVLPNPPSSLVMQQEQDPEAQNQATMQAATEEGNNGASQLEHTRGRNCRQNPKRLCGAVFFPSLAVGWVIFGAVTPVVILTTFRKKSGEFFMWMLVLGLPIVGGLVLCQLLLCRRSNTEIRILVENHA